MAISKQNDDIGSWVDETIRKLTGGIKAVPNPKIAWEDSNGNRGSGASIPPAFWDKPAQQAATFGAGADHVWSDPRVRTYVSVSAYGEEITHVDPDVALFAQLGALKGSDDLAVFCDDLGDEGVLVEIETDIIAQAFGELVKRQRAALVELIVARLKQREVTG